MSAKSSFAAVLLCLGPCASTWADEKLPFPAGVSEQVIQGRTVSLRVPAEPTGERKWGLVLSLGGTIDDLKALPEKEYVVCRASPRVDASGKMWSAAEIKELWALVDHLVKVLPVDPRRLHTAGIEQGIHTIYGPMAFGDGSRFASATFFQSHHRGGAVAPRARKEMGVLAFQWKPDHGEGTSRLPDQLGGKVRSLEMRDDRAGLSGPYFPWWIRTMEGRVVPGDDLSFEWIADVKSAKDLADRQAAASRGAFLYVFAKEDADAKGGPALQTESFLDDRVRKAGRALLAVKVDKVALADWVGTLGIRATPAILVLAKDGREVARLEGAVKTSLLAKALESAAK